MNRNGLTLVEMVIYMALVGIVSVLILSQMKMINAHAVSGRRISGLQSQSRDVAAMLGREIRNTGFKTVLNPTGSNTVQKVTVAGSWLGDSSSFIHKEGDPSDTLTILKARVNNSAQLMGIDTIRYHLQKNNLNRYHGSDSMILASNVYALQFQYGVFDIDSTILDQSTANTANWTASNCSIGAFGGAMRLSIATASTGFIRHITPLSFNEDQRVEIHFELDPQGGFLQVLDWMEWALTNSSGTVVTSERFLPYDSPAVFTLSVPKTSDLFLSLRFKTDGPGTLLVKGVVLQRADLGRYIWKDNPQPSEKKGVKAIRIGLVTRSDGETGMSVNSPWSVGNVAISRSGRYSWRRYVETVEIPNNGLF